MWKHKQFLENGVGVTNLLEDNVLPGTGLNIPGRHVNADGYVADGDGYIVLAAPIDWGNVKGRTYPTPFGYTGKVYDANGTPYSHSGKPVLDVYIR